MTTLLRRYPWVPSLLVGVLWIVAVVDARNQLRALASTVVQLATARGVMAAPAPVVATPVAAAPVVAAPVRLTSDQWGRFVPEIRDGRATGLRLYSIPANSPLAWLGFRNGDVLRTINGFDMHSPEQALRAYAWLKTSSSFVIELERNGERITNSYRFQ